ncbi:MULTISPECIES: (2Fe-2S)-binding protein [unclassified Nocardioides]|uniref:(2Fe-2S)-binding protein n=1 Tax=unclassified Nocardioides TaxID=2615069 RepID=UPI00266593C8|nr:(2Fe-2S)-binding protein [Nocardioides sp. Arc9.136]WKN48938.1 (2Fe-2S)-binding protein [Nocardioides sp. Arc9.136]
MSAERVPTSRGEQVVLTYEGRPIACHAGETLAAALLVAGDVVFSTMPDGSPRAPFCNMGTCFDCALVVDGVPLTRSCLTEVRDGMEVQRWTR